MAVYEYKEVDGSGRISAGTFTAKSKAEVVAMLREKGSRPVAIKEQEEKSSDIGSLQLFTPKVKLKDISIFCKQLYTMLNAGMPLVGCVDVLQQQTENKTLQGILKEVYGDLQKGTVFSQAMKKHSRVFPPLLINMIQAGELTGNLDEVMDKMAVHYEKENKINAKIKAAMVYPIILSVVAVGVVVLILVGIMPMFTGIFNDAGVELPASTRMLISLSDAIKHYWYIMLAVIGGGIFFLKQFFSRGNGKRSWDRFVLKAPLVKKSVQMIITSRFTRTLSTLLSSGIPILSSIESAAEVTGSTVVIEGMDQVAEDIKKGSAMSLLMKRLNIFPPMMISMISIGEESGNIETMLSKTADYYDQELDEAITKLVAMIEPALIVIMGFVIGFIVISIMFPMFEMTTVIK